MQPLCIPTLIALVMLATPCSVAAAAPRVAVSKTPVALGDIDGDGRPDAAAVFRYVGDGGPDRVFVAVLERTLNGAWETIATVRVEDGAVIERLRIVTGRLTVVYRRHYAVDPPCCPRWETVRSYALSGGALHGGDHRPPRGPWRQAIASALAP